MAKKSKTTATPKSPPHFAKIPQISPPPKSLCETLGTLGPFKVAMIAVLFFGAGVVLSFLAGVWTESSWWIKPGVTSAVCAVVGLIFVGIFED